MRALPLLILTVMLVISARGQAPATDLYDSGFRPDVNGFGFENWGTETESTGLTPAGMQRMFGDGVFASRAGGKDILSPPAKAWMEQANGAMGYGHCEGMAVLSNLMYFGQIAPDKFGAAEASSLSFGKTELQEEIAYWWVTQVTSPGNSRRVSNSPREVLDTLIAAFRQGRNATEWWTLGLYLPDGNGGHAITPFAVQNSSNGTARILVYDNNFPKATRAVEIDLAKNAWQYEASINPAAVSSLYSGNESTKSLEIVSVPPRLLPQRCDFCDSSASANLSNTRGSLAGGNVQFWLNGEARLLVTDKNGSRTGHLPTGEFVNENPRANVTFLKFVDDPGGVESPPVISEPAEDEPIPSISGTDEGGSSDLSQFGPNYVAQAKGIELSPGETAHLDVTPTGDVLDVKLTTENLGATTAVSLVLGITTPDKVFTFTIQDASIQQDGSLGLHFDPDQGTFSFDTSGNSNPGQLKFIIEQTDTATGEQKVFANGEYSLKENDRVSIDLGSASENGYTVGVENGGRTTTLTLQDDPTMHPVADMGGDQEVGEPETSGDDVAFSPDDFKLIVHINTED